MTLRAKLILSFSLLILVTYVLAIFLTFEQMREAFKDELRHSLMDLAQVISLSVDGDQTMTFSKPEDEQREDYKAVRSQLIRLKNQLPEVRFVYLYRAVAEEGKVQMIVGGEAWDAPDEDVTHFALGDYPKEEYPRLHEGLEKPSADDDLTFEPQFGWSLSGYAPVLNKAGEKVAAVGLDYPANGIKQKEKALLNLLVVSSVVAVIIALITGYVLANVISKPLRQLVSATDEIAGGDLQAQVNIDRKDEIGALAVSFNKMVRNLREMATALQGYTTRAVETKELEAASKVQRALVPSKGLKNNGVEIASVLRKPSDFGGGVLFDYFLFGNDSYLMFSMGRTNAIGLEAIALLTVCKSSISSMVSNLIFRPKEILENLSSMVQEHHSESGVLGFLCVVYDVQHGWLTVANAGHAYPYLLRPATGNIIQIDQDSGPLLPRKGGVEYTDFDIQMEPGDCFIAFEPYLIEAQNPAGESFGLQRFEDSMRRHANLEPEALKEALLADVLSFLGQTSTLEDDLALVVIRFGETRTES